MKLEVQLYTSRSTNNCVFFQASTEKYLAKKKKKLHNTTHALVFIKPPGTIVFGLRELLHPTTAL